MNAKDEKKQIGNIEIPTLILFLEKCPVSGTPVSNWKPGDVITFALPSECPTYIKNPSHVWSIWWFPEIGVPSNHPLRWGFPLQTIHLGNSPINGNPLYVPYWHANSASKLGGDLWRLIPSYLGFLKMGTAQWLGWDWNILWQFGWFTLW